MTTSNTRINSHTLQNHTIYNKLQAYRILLQILKRKCTFMLKNTWHYLERRRDYTASIKLSEIKMGATTMPITEINCSTNLNELCTLTEKKKEKIKKSLILTMIWEATSLNHTLIKYVKLWLDKNTLEDNAVNVRQWFPQRWQNSAMVYYLTLLWAPISSSMT